MMIILWNIASVFVCFQAIVHGRPREARNRGGSLPFTIPTLQFSYDPRATLSDYLHKFTQNVEGHANTRTESASNQKQIRPIAPPPFNSLAAMSRSFMSDSPKYHVGPYDKPFSLGPTSQHFGGQQVPPSVISHSQLPAKPTPTTVSPALVRSLCNQTLTGEMNSTFGRLDTSSTEVKYAILRQHNCLRRVVPAVSINYMMTMSWDAEAAENALAWANRCQFRNPTTHWERKQFLLSTSQHHFTDCTQQIAAGFASWDDAVNQWFQDATRFIQGALNTPAAASAVTSMNSFRVGCGVARCPFSQLSPNPVNYLVCNYCPNVS